MVPRGRDYPGPAPPDAHDGIPALLDVVLASLTGIPRQQSIGEDLERVNEYNREVARRRGRRSELLAELGPETLSDLAARVADVYVSVRATDLVDSMMSEVFARAAAHDAIADPKDPTSPEAGRGAMERALRAAFAEPVPAPFENDRPLTQEWPFGISPLEQWASVVTDILRTALQLVPLEDQPVRAELRTLRGGGVLGHRVAARLPGGGAGPPRALLARRRRGVDRRGRLRRLGTRAALGLGGGDPEHGAGGTVCLVR